MTHGLCKGIRGSGAGALPNDARMGVCGERPRAETPPFEPRGGQPGARDTEHVANQQQRP